MTFNPKAYKNKKVTIMGLGLHSGGVGTAKFFANLGAKVLVTDIRKKEDLKESLDKLQGLPIRYVLGQHRSEDFINTDLLVKNPAVPKTSKYLEIARAHNIPIETDVGIFFEICPSQTIIGVTGTRGKSTTAALIAHLLKAKYKKVALAGNIRTSALEVLEKIDPETLVVLELSSWQLEGLTSHQKSPKIAVVTNLYPDHLNRYKSLTDYIEAKKIIFKFQKSKDFLVLNEEDKTVKNFAQEASSQVLFFNKKQVGGLAELFLLPGEHNLENLAAAVKTVKILGLDTKNIQAAVQTFKGLAGRLQLIGEKNGIKFINDTTATIPEATIAALNTLLNSSAGPLQLKESGGIILIAGGADKNLNFETLAQCITPKVKEEKIKSILLLKGTATEKIEKALISASSKLRKKKEDLIFQFDNLPEAVQKANQIAQPGDIVLLSPACASFGLFRHEFERGEAFNKAVANLQ